MGAVRLSARGEPLSTLTSVYPSTCRGGREGEGGRGRERERERGGEREREREGEREIKSYMYFFCTTILSFLFVDFSDEADCYTVVKA